MRDYYQLAARIVAYLLKRFHETRKAPQVDARLGLVEHRQLGAARQHRRDFDTLSLAARQCAAHFAVDILFRTQAHLAEQTAQLRVSETAACRQFKQISNCQPLESHGLLKRVSNTLFGAFGYIEIGQILAVEQYPSRHGLFHTRYQFGESGLSAAVWSRDNCQPAVGFAGYPVDYGLAVRQTPVQIIYFKQKPCLLLNALLNVYPYCTTSTFFCQDTLFNTLIIPLFAYIIPTISEIRT